LPYDGDVLRPLVCTALASALLASGCSGAAVPAAAARPASLVIAYAESRPQSDAGRGINTIAGHLRSERLVQLRRDGRPEAALAERWTQSADGRAWRFTLRQGLTFQDGTPIGAEAARRSLQELLAGAAGDARALRPGLRDVTGIEVASPTELVVRLSRPNALLLDDLALLYVTGKNDTQAGPFRLHSEGKGELVLTSFDHHYRGRPGLSRIRILAFPSHRMAWSAMLRGEVDCVYDVAPEAIDFAERSPATQVATFLRPYATAMVFNMAHPMLRRRDVRVALNMGVNRTEILRIALQNRGYPATDHVWPKHWAHDPLSPRLRHDTMAARARLEAAGLPAVRAHGRTTPRFAFRLLLPSNEPRIERVALLLQRQLIEIDVDLQLESVALVAFQERVRAGRYDAFLIELAAGHGLNLTHHLWHSAGSTLVSTGYSGADAALDQVRDARSDADTRAAVDALHRAMYSDPPAVFLYWSEVSRAISSRFQVPREDDRDIMSTVALWRASPS
jgi:peptide/nickel transport system substrate-binding protein